jgi:hypothetical protein
VRREGGDVLGGGRLPVIRGILTWLCIGALAGLWLVLLIAIGPGGDHEFLDDLDDL